MKKSNLAVKKKIKFKLFIKKYAALYLFLLPAIIYLIVFSYAPMYGLQIAFRKYTFANGIFGSKWVGLDWFGKFVGGKNFWKLIENTFALSIYSIVVGFPLPIMLAVVLNSLRNKKFKRFAQTITYMPHFISTVVLVGMLSIFLSPNSGLVNTIVGLFGGPSNTYFMGQSNYFRHIYVWSGVWQEIGWGSIIYLSALTGVDPSLHEAAMLDGASEVQRIRHIDIPTIVPTISIMLIMRLGKIMNVGYEKVFLMQNTVNVDVAEVFATYVYKMGIRQMNYSYATAVGLFNNIVNFILLIIVNRIVGKISGERLW